jgi:hypothetical protein
MKQDVFPLPVDEEGFQITRGPRGNIFLQGDTEDQGSVRTTVYSLDTKSFKFEMVTQMSCEFLRGPPYFDFPPFISPTRM